MPAPPTVNAIARYPANPEEIFARRLREFLDETADANFSARTIHLTGGPDGIEFVDPADRKRSTIWQMAVIAGPRGDHRGACRGRGVAEGDRAMSAISRRQALALLAAVPVRRARGGSGTAGAEASRRDGFRPRFHPGARRHASGVAQGRQATARRSTRSAWVTIVRSNPTRWPRFPISKNVVKVAAGTAVSFAVLADGRLLAWGLNAGNGLLGTTPRSAVEVSASWGPNSNVPVPLAVTFDAVDVCTEDLHALALARDGRSTRGAEASWANWGSDRCRSSTSKRGLRQRWPSCRFPFAFPDLTDVDAIAAGRKHGLALLKDGTVRAWGENRSGQVGDGTMIKRDAPVPVLGVRNAVAIAAGAGDLSAALLADGTVMTWGGTDEGGLGRVPFNKPSPTPALVPGVRGVRAIAVGSSHMIALTETGSVITWGSQRLRKSGPPKDENVPGVVPSVTNVQSICASNTTSVAVLESGRIMTWGGEVRPWNRPEGSEVTISRSPILFWLDGLDLP